MILGEYAPDGHRVSPICSLSDPPYLDFVLSQARRRTLVQVGRQVLVDVLEDEVEGHLAVATLAVANVQ